MAVEQAPELQEVAQRFNALLRSKNFSAARELLSADDSFVAIGTDAHEVWESREAMMPEFEHMASSAETGGLDTEMGDLRCYRDGDVGWIVGLHGVFKRSDGTTVPNRSVVIVRREDGEWKAVCSIASIPVPNAVLDDPDSPLSRELAAGTPTGA
jgi:ketosteroid isomerase-like protein